MAALPANASTADVLSNTRRDRASNWEGAYRVPAMFSWPGKIRPGLVSNEIVAHLDLLPTILAVAGDTEVDI
jgi:arylsulfatase A-like enzyme